VDRTACAWLIRRFIDTSAEFVFVDDPEDVPGNAQPFDMRGVAFSHRAGRCTFETLLESSRSSTKAPFTPMAGSRRTSSSTASPSAASSPPR
jgi:hypothetical protein